MAGVNSRQEYLKRYLDDPKLSKSKKKKRKSESCCRQPRFKIVDEDIDMKKIEVSYKEDDESDEAPFIASVVDDRPEEVKVNEMYSSEHWKKFDSPVKVKLEIIESTELSNSSCNFSLPNGTEVKRRNDSDDDLSPLRRSSVKLTSEGLQKLPRNKNMQRDSDSDISPPRVRNTATSDSDLSPPRGIIKGHHRKEDRSPPRNKDHHHYRKIDKIGGQHHVQKDSSPSRSKAKDQHNKLRNLSPSGSKADKWCHKQKNISPVHKTDGVHHIQKDYFSGRTETNSKYSSHSYKKQSSQVQHSSDSDYSPPRERRHDDDERHNFDNRARHNKIQADHLRSFKPSQYSLPLEKQQDKRMKKRGTDNDNEFYSDKEYNRTKRKNVEKQHSKRTKKRYDTDHSDSHSENKRNCSKRKKLEKQHSERTKKRYDSDHSDSHSENERNCSKRKNLEKQSSKRTKEKLDSDSDSSSHCEKEHNCTKSKNVEKQHGKRTKKRHDSDGDSDSHSDKEKNSAKRKNVSYLNSQSSVPKGKSYRMEEESRHKPHTSSDLGVKKARPNATLSGMKAGLQDSASLQEEIRNLKYREKMALDGLDDELSGRNAETVSRDRSTGQRRNLKEERLEQKEKDKKKAEKLEKYLVWGKGLKQKDDQQKKIQEDMHEMSKPLARYADDDDLERELKVVLREGDPMLEYIKKKRRKNEPTATSSLPVYEGPPAPPNRFSIPPGYRWDGVDRSNGFEKRFFEKISNTKATEHQAYLWSIENM